MPAELQRTMSEFTKRKLYLACCSDTGHGPSGPTCDPHALYHMTLRLSLLVPTYYRYRYLYCNKRKTRAERRHPPAPSRGDG